MHEYFSFEDLDATKVTKLILYFYHFSMICYVFYKISAELNNFWKTLNPKQGLTAGPHWSVRGPAQPQLAHVMARRRQRSGRRRAGRRECGARPRLGRQGGFRARGGGVQPRVGAARDVRAAAGRQPRRCSCAPAMRRRKDRGKGSERVRRAWGSSPRALFGWR